MGEHQTIQIEGRLQKNSLVFFTASRSWKTKTDRGPVQSSWVGMILDCFLDQKKDILGQLLKFG